MASKDISIDFDFERALVDFVALTGLGSFNLCSAQYLLIPAEMFARPCLDTFDPFLRIEFLRKVFPVIARDRSEGHRVDYPGVLSVETTVVVVPDLDRVTDAG